MSALVKAAKDMLIATIATQMALVEGGDEYSSRATEFPFAGTRLCQPPLPVWPVSGGSGTGSSSSVFAGGKVVAIESTVSLFAQGGNP
jgi:hypothetical protein